MAETTVWACKRCGRCGPQEVCPVCSGTRAQLPESDAFRRFFEANEPPTGWGDYDSTRAEWRRSDTTPQVGVGAPKPFTLDELGNTYVGTEDRYVVSLIVGYKTADGVETPEQALSRALALTTDLDSRDTHWYVFDRETKTLHLIEQGEGEDVESYDEGEEADDVRS